MEQEQAALYRVLASASQDLLLSWSTAGADGEKRPSFLIGALRRLLSGLPETRENELEQSYRLEAERPRFDLACCGASRDSSPAAQAALRAQPTPIQPMEQSVRGPLRNPDVVHQLYGKKLRMTASRVDAFYRCQYAYFLRYGLRAKERRRASFDAPETGTFLHFVLVHSSKCGSNIRTGCRRQRRYTSWRGAGRRFMSRHSSADWNSIRRDSDICSAGCCI